jgi:hypothetical protein
VNILPAWKERPYEEAHLFNPAFCGSIAYEFVKSYVAAADRASVELPLVFCALPVCLHLETRQKLPARTVTSLYTWLQRQPEVLVGFAGRARDMAPYIREAISFGMARGVFDFAETGELMLGKKRAFFTPKFLETSTNEVREIAVSTRLIGRWFAGAGGAPTILAAWGVTV